MLKLNSLGVAISLSVAMTLWIGDAAFAAKHAHLTYAQAYARCKVHVDTIARDAHQQRYSRGSSCMHTYGYKL
jgi:hypothetical protein